ncbi:hypothetical protein YC2023_022943 [Brassica napus]
MTYNCLQAIHQTPHAREKWKQVKKSKLRSRGNLGETVTLYFKLTSYIAHFSVFLNHKKKNS